MTIAVGIVIQGFIWLIRGSQILPPLVQNFCIRLKQTVLRHFMKQSVSFRPDLSLFLSEEIRTHVRIDIQSLFSENVYFTLSTGCFLEFVKEHALCYCQNFPVLGKRFLYWIVSFNILPRSTGLHFGNHSRLRIWLKTSCHFDFHYIKCYWTLQYKNSQSSNQG